MRSGPAAGIRIVIDPQVEKFMWTGVHEVAVQEQLERLLRPGMTFWDVGAHAGFFTFLAARLVGGRGRVDAFEPLASNRERLETARRLNGAANVHVHEDAVAGESGVGVLYGAGASVTWTLVAPETAQETVAVRCRTLDELADLLPPPDVLKIDVEGAELAVLRAGQRLLAERRPPVLVELNAEAADAVRTLLPFYALERLDETHWLLQPSD